MAPLSRMPAPTERPDNLTFVSIPDGDVPRETDELSFVLRPFLALFLDDTVRRIPYAEMDKNPQLKAFCLVYGIERREYVCVPHSFTKMELGWYLNHSKTPNTVHDGKWIAARDIGAGEELTIDYGDNF